jgi:hypothetical protein
MASAAEQMHFGWHLGLLESAIVHKTVLHMDRVVLGLD